MASGKYVKDYTLQDAPGADGKPVYIGAYYGYRADAETLRRARRGYQTAVAVCAAAALAPLLVNTPIIRCWYVMLPLVFALLPTGALVHRAATVLRRDRLTHRERDRAVSAAPWSVALVILAALSLVGQTVLAARGGYTAADLPVTLSALVLASGAARLFSLRGAFATEELAAD